MSEDGLLASAFQGPSWRRWRAILRAAFAEALDAEDEGLFREVAERDPPAARVRELWCIVGRGGGKDSIASCIATVAALGNHRQHLRPGERATVACLAANKDQAEIVRGYIVGYFDEIELLKPLVDRKTDDGLLLRNGCEIVAFPNSFRSIRGRTIVCAILDECGFWRDARSVAPDVETYHAILPSLERVPGSMLVGISTPYRRSGLLFEKFSESYGRPDPDVLVVRGGSRLFNPLVRQRTIDDAMARDPDRAASEWLVEWRSDLSDFISRELVEAAVDAGVAVRPAVRGVEYLAFADPSGGRGDGFACAVAHAEGDRVVLDALYERTGAFDPTAVVAEIAELLRSYGIGRLTGDKYAAGWPPEAFAKHGIRYEASERDRSALYLDALPLFTSGRARLLDNRRLVYQFASLERRTSRFGRDAVNHPGDGHDDLANAAAGALVLAATDARPALIRARDLLAPDGGPVPMPRYADSILGVLIASASGMAAVTFWAQYTGGNQSIPPLALLDFAVEGFTGELIDRIAARLEELHRDIARVAYGRFLWVPRALVQAVHLRGFRCEDIPPDVMRDPSALAMAAAAHIAAGQVRMAEAAAEKARTSPLAGALSFQVGERVDADPLRFSLLTAIVIALTPADAVIAPVLPVARMAAA